MTEHSRIVKPRDVGDRLPEWASGGLVVLEWLRQQGRWEEATDLLKVQREGGYAGVDALLFLIYYFASGLRVGVKEFSDRAREQHGRLAAVVGRRRLPTQASVSRILAAVESETARNFGNWLLRQAPGIDVVLQHPSVLTRDAVGGHWHVFDWDPTVTTLRHRALPEFEGTPEARRRSESIAARGYPGRKRGDAQFSRATLQHAGSGLWLGIEMAPGNGALREEFEGAIGQVVATCEHAGLARDSVFLRADGAAGNVPFLTACVESDVHYVTRLAHYQLLQEPNIVAHLNEAVWYEVPSSGSGPMRQACDLGRVRLEPAPGTVRLDGNLFDPIAVRVVVSRFPSQTENGRGAGVVIDGWQYELYGTDLTPEAWPEAELVAGYYGRTGQENRFHQEDRELGLDRIFSYHLPGQQLATLVGLFVWNFQICRGMELTRPPEELVDQSSAVVSPASERVVLPEAQEVEPVSDDPSSQASVTEDRVPSGPAPEELVDQPSVVVSPASERVVLPKAHEVEPVSDDQASQSSVIEDEVPSASPPLGTRDRAPNRTEANSGGTVGDEPDGAAVTPAESMDNAGTRGEVIEALDALDWGPILNRHVDWRWSGQQGGLHCPGKAVLPLIRVEHMNDGRIRARFQALPGACGSCDLRDGCVRSKDPHYRKDVRLSLPTAHAASIREKWLSLSLTQQRVVSPKSSAAGRPSPGRPIWRLKKLGWETLATASERSPFAVTPPTLLPAALRRATRSAVQAMEARVRVQIAPSCASHPALAQSAAERQQRRLSWEERLRWNALPAGSSVELALHGGSEIAALLGCVAPAPELAGTAC